MLGFCDIGFTNNKFFIFFGKSIIINMPVELKISKGGDLHYFA